MAAMKDVTELSDDESKATPTASGPRPDDSEPPAAPKKAPKLPAKKPSTNDTAEGDCDPEVDETYPSQKARRKRKQVGSPRVEPSPPPVLRARQRQLRPSQR